jgi:phage-related protein
MDDNLCAMKWTITFYNSRVESETLAFPKGILANLLRIFDLIELYGPAIGKPHTAPMGGGLFEIRTKGKEGIGRSLFCSVEGCEVVILHSFIKKTNKTPKKDLDLALKRLKEFKYVTTDL